MNSTGNFVNFCQYWILLQIAEKIGVYNQVFPDGIKRRFFEDKIERYYQQNDEISFIKVG